MKNLIQLCLLVVTSTFFLTGSIYAQIVADDNGASVGQSGVTSLTISDFSVPSGADQLLVVSAYTRGGNSTITSITYDGQNLTAGGTTTSGVHDVHMYYLVLGSTSGITSDIVATYGGTVTQNVIGAHSYQNVDQSNPIGNTAQNPGTGTVLAPVTINTASGDAVVDVVGQPRSSGDEFIPGASQTEVFEDVTSNSKSAGSYALATGSSVTLSWISTNDVGTHVQFAMQLNGVQAIPTMGEWALILLGLTVLSIGVVSVMRWQTISNRKLAA